MVTWNSLLVEEEQLKKNLNQNQQKKKLNEKYLHLNCIKTYGINEIKNNEKNINEEVFKGYLFNHTLLLLAKELYNSNQNVNGKIVKYINDSLIELKRDINTNKIPKNKNPNKIVNIIEKILNFNKQQKVKGFLRT